jgi:hypothetical protein
MALKQTPCSPSLMSQSGLRERQDRRSRERFDRSSVSSPSIQRLPMAAHAAPLLAFLISSPDAAVRKIIYSKCKICAERDEDEPLADDQRHIAYAYESDLISCSYYLGRALCRGANKCTREDQTLDL